MTERFKMMVGSLLLALTGNIAIGQEQSMRPEVAQILARPLFAPDRLSPRPAEVAQAKAPAPAFDARLAGVLRIGGKARAVFVTGSETVIAGQGETIGVWSIDLIDARSVALSNGAVRVVAELSVGAAEPSGTTLLAVASPSQARGKSAAQAEPSDADLAPALAALIGEGSQLAAAGLGNFPESGAEFQPRRVVGGRSVAAEPFEPRFDGRPIDRFAGISVPDAVPQPQPRSGGLADIGSIDSDDFFSGDASGDLAAASSILRFPGNGASFRGRFVTKMVSLRRGSNP